ncbi:cell division cycle-associated protein 7-like [Ciona intestinalis]
MAFIVEKELNELFNETGDAEEFLGFTELDFSKEISVDGSTLEESDSDSDSDDDHQSIVKHQKAQMQAKKQMLSQLMAELDKDPVFLKMKTSTPEQIKRFQTTKKLVRSPTRRYTQNTRGPPLTRRRSSMVGNVEYPDGLNDDGADTLRSRLTVRFTSMKRKISNDDPAERTPKRRHVSSLSQPHIIIPVEDVTQEMLDNIAEHSVGKTYDTINGTSCHQCRQKTIDTKSCCRGEDCSGVRGQFCGPCLKNRYGELVENVLLDSEWKCPVCRNICNCSICRNRKGKCATGILIGIARQQGHSNVRAYLENLGEV